MVKTEPIAEVVAIKKAEQVPLEPLTLLPQLGDPKAGLRNIINRFRAK